ncbi:regulatory protein for cyclic-di-GMP, EAL domain protein [Psychromonas ingrahamii 37]|uniref:Regulatory protein for cyclic-di-GMP, EAL domain protein n=1 Tax=Psychromonas ingrahamii (strain DSM 17664 / CCUG 51855 / 37) TaxID=357804 RepID=A1SZ76_PSYIN|nr:EAL domain-containing protein [Psychromonas ingrahamii]ABM04791.1 regulatory protein for cyclic-di-GMP, EAL domain protein [Psychromonas ingrahamii 37]
MIKGIEYTHAFQPIINIDAGKVVSYEVLLRGKHNEPPGFIFDQVPTESLMEFDQANRERAIKQASNLGLECSLNLNFTPGSILFEGGKYVEETIAVSQYHGIDAKQLVIEMTECEAINTASELSNVLNKLRRTGVTIALDDFGSGYAGLNLLVDVQPDLIKLDMYLLRNIDKNGPRQAIVRAIFDVCLDLGIDVLAEGVETEEEFDFLNKLGVSLYQGYLFAKPGFESFPPVSIQYLKR